MFAATAGSISGKNPTIRWSLWRWLDVGTGGVVHDQDTAVGEGFDGMRRAGREGGGDSKFELAFEDFLDFFLRMEMLLNGSAARELVMGESHILRMEIAVVPAGKTLDDPSSVRASGERLEVDEGHGIPARVNGGQASEVNRKSFHGHSAVPGVVPTRKTAAQNTVGIP
jgi:hypothetical protein